MQLQIYLNIANNHLEVSTCLYISYDGMTDPLGQSQVIPYLKGLSKAGFKIVLISFEKRSQSSQMELVKSEFTSAGILWRPLKYHKNPSLLATILDLLIGTFFTLYYCKKYAIKLIHCRGHYLTSLMAFLVLPFHNFKYIFDMRGFWADERIEGQIWDSNKPLHRYQYLFFKKMEKVFLGKADQIITLTEAAKEIIEYQFKIKKTNIDVIPCSADLELFRPDAPFRNHELIQHAKKEGKIVLVYLGSLGTWYILDKMLLFFKLLKEEMDAVFLFITAEPAEFIWREAFKIGLKPGDLIIEKASRNEVPGLLAASDIGIFFIKQVFSKLGSSPVKHGEMMACGLPVVTNSGIGDVEKIIDESKTGLVIKNWNTASMKRAAQEILKLLKGKDASKYRESAEKYYSLNLAVNKYITIYSNLTNE